ncbi:hypothetical protein Tco_1129340, partial [Tanacetum coccineum]
IKSYEDLFLTKPKSDKESPEVEITNVVIHVNVNEEEEEITDEVYELKRREKGKIGRYRYLFEHLKAKFLSRKSFDTLVDHLQEVMVESLPMMAEISSQIQQAIDNHIPSLVDEFVRNYMSGHTLHVHPAQPQTTSIPEQQYRLYLSMKNNPQLQQHDIAIWLALQMKFETLQDDPHNDALPEGENSAKRQKTYEYKAYVIKESSGKENESEQSPSSSGNQEQ